MSLPLCVFDVLPQAAVSVKCWECCVYFRTGHPSALPVKRLWQFLVKQEEVQETFIRYIFTKKRDPNEVLVSKRCVANPHRITQTVLF